MPQAQPPRKLRCIVFLLLLLRGAFRILENSIKSCFMMIYFTLLGKNTPLPHLTILQHFLLVLQLPSIQTDSLHRTIHTYLSWRFVFEEKNHNCISTLCFSKKKDYGMATTSHLSSRLSLCPLQPWATRQVPLCVFKTEICRLELVVILLMPQPPSVCRHI